MSGSEETVEGGGEGGDPFGPEVHNDAVHYVIDRWKYLGDNLVIEGKVTEVSSTMHLKRGDYQSDAISATIKLEPKNLKCDLVVRHPAAEINQGGDDLAIVGLVFRRFGNELALQAQQIMVEHMKRVYPEPEKGGTRVDAGERRDKANGQQSDEF